MRGTCVTSLRSDVCALLALAVIAGAGLSACGDDDGDGGGTPQADTGKPPDTAEQPATGAPLDTDEVESQLKASLSGSTVAVGPEGRPGEGGLKADSVTCPSEIEKREGQTFQCKVRGTNQDPLLGKVKQSGTVDVTQDDSQGRKLSYKATLEGEGLKTEQEGDLRLK